MTTEERTQRLLDLGKAEFGRLTWAEATILRAMAQGTVADFSVEGEDDIPGSELLQMAHRWRGETCTIEADRLVWFCTDPQVAAEVTFRGLRVKGLRVEGEWNLEQATVGFPLEFRGCLFAGVLNFSQGNFKSLSLVGCEVLPPPQGADVLLNLDDTTVQESVDLTDSLFRNKGKNSLWADRSEITGQFLLTGRFESEGYVGITGAQIGLIA
ncbi:hypothetical protein, partial [Prochlorothrix hollandica]|uniref:hypothetical protein n=1 Tax=Prochlorothrix hollandica TaxID=1223 RepID=UPI0033425A99